MVDSWITFHLWQGLGKDNMNKVLFREAQKAYMLGLFNWFVYKYYYKSY